MEAVGDLASFASTLRAFRRLPHITAKLAGEINATALRRSALVRLSTFLRDEGELEGATLEAASTTESSASFTTHHSACLTPELTSWIFAALRVEPVTAVDSGAGGLQVAVSPLLVVPTNNLNQHSSGAVLVTKALDASVCLKSLYTEPENGHRHQVDLGGRSVLTSEVHGSDVDNFVGFRPSHIEHVLMHLYAAASPNVFTFNQVARLVRSVMHNLQPSTYPSCARSLGSGQRHVEEPFTFPQIPLFELPFRGRGQSLAAVAPPSTWHPTAPSHILPPSSSPLAELSTLLGGMSAAVVTVRALRILPHAKRCVNETESSTSTQFEIAVDQLQKLITLEASVPKEALRVALALALSGMDALVTDADDNLAPLGVVLQQRDHSSSNTFDLDAEWAKLVRSLETLVPFTSLYCVAGGDGGGHCPRFHMQGDYRDVASQNRVVTFIPGNHETEGVEVATVATFGLKQFPGVWYRIQLPISSIEATFGGKTPSRTLCCSSDGSVPKTLDILHSIRLGAIGSSFSNKLVGNNVTEAAVVVPLSPLPLASQFLMALGDVQQKEISKGLSTAEGDVVEKRRATALQVRSNYLSCLGAKRPRPVEQDDEQVPCDVVDYDRYFSGVFVGGGTSSNLGGNNKEIPKEIYVDPSTAFLLKMLRRSTTSGHQPNTGDAVIVDTLITKAVDALSALVKDGLPKPPVLPSPPSHTAMLGTAPTSTMTIRIGTTPVAPPPTTFATKASMLVYDGSAVGRTGPPGAPNRTLGKKGPVQSQPGAAAPVVGAAPRAVFAAPPPSSKRGGGGVVGQTSQQRGGGIVSGRGRGSGRGGGGNDVAVNTINNNNSRGGAQNRGGGGSGRGGKGGRGK